MVILKLIQQTKLNWSTVGPIERTRNGWVYIEFYFYYKILKDWSTVSPIERTRNGWVYIEFYFYIFLKLVQLITIKTMINIIEQ